MAKNQMPVGSIVSGNLFVAKGNHLNSVKKDFQALLSAIKVVHKLDRSNL